MVWAIGATDQCEVILVSMYELTHRSDVQAAFARAYADGVIRRNPRDVLVTARVELVSGVRPLVRSC